MFGPLRMWHGSLAGAGVARGRLLLDKECLTLRPRLVSGPPLPTPIVSRCKNGWESALTWHHSVALRRGVPGLCEESDDKQIDPGGNPKYKWSNSFNVTV